MLALWVFCMIIILQAFVVVVFLFLFFFFLKFLDQLKPLSSYFMPASNLLANACECGKLLKSYLKEKLAGNGQMDSRLMFSHTKKDKISPSELSTPVTGLQSFIKLDHGMTNFMTSIVVAFLARLHEVLRAIAVTPVVHVPVPVRVTLALKFSRSPYLDNHPSESIHTWTIDTL